jgi:hypothetical protein
MSDVRCPQCFSTDVGLLDFTSMLAYVYCYPCDVCGHVWTVPKPGQQGLPQAVTVQRHREGDNS